jgi:uncharacterized membrane protein YdbT with pleckstrin-like domain
MLTGDDYKQAEFEFGVAEARRGFKIHATVYAAVMTGLIILNGLLIAFTDANFPWAVFPLVCWGLGLTAHYFCGYRSAERQVRARQESVEHFAETVRKAA